MFNQMQFVMKFVLPENLSLLKLKFFLKVEQLQQKLPSRIATLIKTRDWIGPK